MPADDTLHILHTNDFHNALSEAGASRLREAITTLDGAPYLLLDAGDAIKAGNIGVNPFGEPILDRMSDLGYHAMTLGNREFHVAHAALETKINRARFPVLCANMRARGGSHAPPVVPHKTFDVDGRRITVFGVTVPMVTERMKVALAMSQFVFDDPVATAARMAVELRENCDLLIALTHIGIREDERLARTVPSIDLIVGGHSHVTLATPETVGGVPIVQAGWHAHHYGHVQVKWPSDSGRPQIEGELHPLQDRAKGQAIA